MSLAVRHSPLQRLRTMDAAEIRFRASVALRNAVDRVRASVAPPVWDRSALRVAGPGLEPARALLSRRDWLGAHRALAKYFKDRPPLFPLSPDRAASAARMVRSRFPRVDACTRADRVLAGRHDLLGYTNVDVGSPPDWHRDPVHDRRAPLLFWDAVPYLDPSCGDHKITWELNRHQHFLVLGRAFHLTGDERYYREFVRQLTSWIAANPPLQGANWSSMLELALRSVSWLWALQFFAGAAGDSDEHPWIVDLLLALDRQLLHVEHNLSRYFSPNTHLSGEALALYVVGRTLPELGDAGTRATTGRSVLIDEATRQVNPDGGHAELSTHYHRYSTDFYLLALNVARATSDPAAAAFEAAARRQAVYLRTMATDRGELPQLGDDDGGQLFPICGRPPADCRDTLANAAVLLDDASLSTGKIPEETYWFCANQDIVPWEAEATPWPSRRFESSGYCVSRNDRGDHLIFDCGRHGFRNGGHAHSDALAVVLSISGHPLLIDPGTATYTMNPVIRNRFRSTEMHNTVTINGRPQSEPHGPFHWQSTIDARCTAWSTRAGMDYAEGRHDGYPGITHIRRVLSLHGVGWIILDHLVGLSQEVQAQAMWHVHPAWRTVRDGDGRIRLDGPDGLSCVLVTTGALTEVEGPEAAYSPVYGPIEPAPCFAAAVTGGLPLSLATFINATPMWQPDALFLTAPETFTITTPGGTLTVMSKIEAEPLVTLEPVMAESVHPTD